jgi:hypothetical protein
MTVGFEKNMDFEKEKLQRQLHLGEELYPNVKVWRYIDF